ncbi:MAG: hypothetical protein Q7T03_02285 [Deltaproteobacteria bacterium]|nr:hypothetical protein [Deltaproteobacteria bacterium]
MLNTNYFNKLTVFGVEARSRLKNDLVAINSLVKKGFVKKAYKKGSVFYELTEKALPLLDAYRCCLLELARLKNLLYPRRASLYKALLEDTRFVDTSAKEAKAFQFLGDWRLYQKPVRAQLLLSQYRFYQQRGLK